MNAVNLTDTEKSDFHPEKNEPNASDRQTRVSHTEIYSVCVVAFSDSTQEFFPPFSHIVLICRDLVKIRCHMECIRVWLLFSFLLSSPLLRSY